jgi:hypothetical protein
MNNNLEQKLQKYEDLVKYARTQPKHLEFPLVQELVERVNSNYEAEAAALSGPDADWEHGFNSGCLAILRYIQAMEEFGPEAAEEEFPMLDT